jgi:tetratricopeptide (TPR) repeat protein
MITVVLALLTLVASSDSDEVSGSDAHMILVVVTDEAKLMRGKEVVATLPKGHRLPALQIKGNWIGTEIEIDDKKLSGWVDVCHLMIETDSRSRHYQAIEFGHHLKPFENAESPVWRQFLSHDENGLVVLDRQSAYQLALIHSREYQQALEELYLSALAVGRERIEMRKLRRGETRIQRSPDAAPGLPSDADRTLSANIRQMERFRRGFYLCVLAGRDPGAPPSARRPSAGATFTGGHLGIGGYLSLLKQKIAIHNQRAMVTALRENVERMQKFYDVQRIGLFQLDEMISRLYDSQIGLVRDEAAYQRAIDQFKIDLGLPPQLAVKIDDPLLDQFNLIDPELTATREMVALLLDQLRDPAIAGAAVSGPQELIDLLRRVHRDLEMVQRDLQTLNAALPERRACLVRLAEREEFQTRDVDLSLLDVEALEWRVSELKREFEKVRARIEASLGVGQFRVGDWSASVESLERSIQWHLGGDFPAAYRARAWDAALEKLETPTVLAQHRSHRDAVERIADWYYLAMAYWHTGRPEEGRFWYEHAIEWTAANERDNGRLRRLAAEASVVTGLDSPLVTPEDWPFLATVCWQLNRQDEARRRCQEAFDWTVANKPDDEQLRRRVAEASARIGLENPYSEPKDWFYLAMAYWRLGRPGDARLWYRKAIDWTMDAEPNNRELRRLAAQATAITGLENPRATAEDWYYVAMEYWRLGRREDTRHWHQKAIQWTLDNQPDNEKLRRLAAEASARTGLDKLADPEDWFHRAMVYWQLDAKADARVWYQRAVRWTLANQPENEKFRRLADQASEITGLDNPLPAPEEPVPSLPKMVPLPGSPHLQLEIERQRLIPLATSFSSHLTELSLIQARARLDSPTLVPIELSPEEALEIARQNRRDWINARAALADKWRLFGPAVRDLSRDLTQRYDWRRALISLRRARREYSSFEDEVSQILQDTLRTIFQCQILFEIHREAIRTDIRRVIEIQAQLEGPVGPRMLQPILGAQTGRNVVDSLNSLLIGQNRFLAVWVEYESARMGLDLHLGTMELDERGRWIDPGPIQGSGSRASEHLEVIPPGPEIVPRAVIR